MGVRDRRAPSTRRPTRVAVAVGDLDVRRTATGAVGVAPPITPRLPFAYDVLSSLPADRIALVPAGGATAFEQVARGAGGPGTRFRCVHRPRRSGVCSEQVDAGAPIRVVVAARSGRWAASEAGPVTSAKGRRAGGGQCYAVAPAMNDPAPQQRLMSPCSNPCSGQSRRAWSRAAQRQPESRPSDLLSALDSEFPLRRRSRPIDRCRDPTRHRRRLAVQQGRGDKATFSPPRQAHRPQTHDLSIDIVSLEGPALEHTHPAGEVTLGVSFAGTLGRDVRFDGHPPGLGVQGAGKPSRSYRGRWPHGPHLLSARRRRRSGTNKAISDVAQKALSPCVQATPQWEHRPRL